MAYKISISISILALLLLASFCYLLFDPFSCTNDYQLEVTGGITRNNITKVRTGTLITIKIGNTSGVNTIRPEFTNDMTIYYNSADHKLKSDTPIILETNSRGNATLKLCPHTQGDFNLTLAFNDNSNFTKKLIKHHFIVSPDTPSQKSLTIILCTIISCVFLAYLFTLKLLINLIWNHAEIKIKNKLLKNYENH